MLTVTGTIRLSSEHEVERLTPLLVRRAARSRGDEGNLDYVFSRSLEDPCEIRLYEKWESQAALEAHLAIPDPDFDTLLATADFASAIVIKTELGEETVMMKR